MAALLDLEIGKSVFNCNSTSIFPVLLFKVIFVIVPTTRPFRVTAADLAIPSTLSYSTYTVL